MRVLIFGDSITQGYWDTNGGWVDRLRQHYDELQVQDFDVNQPTIFNLGISADNSGDILARAPAEIKARTRHNVPPVVLVQIGINDSCVERSGYMVPLPQYKANLEQIIETLQSITSKLIFIGLSACDETKTTPVVWGDYRYTNADIKAYEDQMKAVAATANVPFLPVFDAFSKAMQSSELLADGLHPTNDGHAMIFEILKPELLRMLESSK